MLALCLNGRISVISLRYGIASFRWGRLKEVGVALDGWDCQLLILGGGTGDELAGGVVKEGTGSRVGMRLTSYSTAG